MKNELQIVGQALHEVELLAKVDEGDVEESTDEHEQDGVDVLQPKVVNDGRDHEIGRDEQHQDRDEQRNLV